MPTVDETKARVQQLLTSGFGKVTIDSDGDFAFHRGSTAAFARVLDWGDGDTIINVHAPVLIDVPITNELCRYIATEVFVLGQLRLWPNDADNGRTGRLDFEYRLIGNDIDESEIGYAVQAVVVTADGLDNTLQARFGGTLLEDS